MSKTALVAVGGNSLIRAGEQGTTAEQLANARRTARAIGRSHPPGIPAGHHPRQRAAGRSAIAALRARLERGVQPDAGCLRRRQPGRDRLPAGTIAAQRTGGRRTLMSRLSAWLRRRWFRPTTPPCSIPPSRLDPFIRVRRRREAADPGLAHRRRCGARLSPGRPFARAAGDCRTGRHSLAGCARTCW